MGSGVNLILADQSTPAQMMHGSFRPKCVGRVPTPFSTLQVLLDRLALLPVF